ncbi:hypothetical protein D3C76_1022240 [compost metagenome]
MRLLSCRCQKHRGTFVYDDIVQLLNREGMRGILCNYAQERATVQRGIAQHLSICTDDTTGVVVEGGVLGLGAVFQRLRGIAGEGIANRGCCRMYILFG